MKPKTTLNLFKNILAINFKENNLSFFGTVLKKAGLSPSSKIYVFVLLLLLSYTVAFSRSGSCQAKLIIDHNLNVGSSSPIGTYYLMVITNTCSSSNTFSLTASNINSNCSNADRSNTVQNVNLETSFTDINLNPISEIAVGSEQSVNFYSHITIPAGTSIKKWCCTQFSAESIICSNYKVSTVLQTYYSGHIEQ